LKAAEEKQRRKDEKKAAKAGTNVVGERSNADAEAEGEGDPGIFDGVGSVTGKAAIQTKGKGRTTIEDVELVSEEDIPILINHDLPNLQSVLDQADVILQILDARDPLAFRSSHLEELAATRPGRRTLLVLNKIGLLIIPSDVIFALSQTFVGHYRYGSSRIYNIVVDLSPDAASYVTLPCLIGILTCSRACHQVEREGEGLRQ
jgi:hypothetical protein